MTFDSANYVLSVCPPPATGCTATSGIQAPAFSSSATGTNSAFVAGQGAATILGNGLGTFQNVVVNGTFNSVATGATKVIQQSNGTFSISGAGDAAFQSVAIGAGGWGINNAGLLTVTSCVGCGAGVAGANTQIQFNNGGVHGASANFTWTSGNTLNISGGAAGALVSLSGDTGTYKAVSYSNGAALRWQAGVDNVPETGGNAGSRYYLTRATDAGAGIDQPFYINRSDGIVRMPDGLAVNSYGLTAAGALNVASCTGCGAGTPGAPFNSIQFNNAGAFGGSANLTWNNGLGLLTLTRTGGNSGILAPVFSGDVAAGGSTFKNSDGSFTVDFAGRGAFQNLTVTTTFNSLATGATSAIQQANGTFSITGAGAFLGQSITTGGNNGTVATAGQGGVINKAGATIALYTYDQNGVCSLGTGNTAPGVLCSSDEKQKKNVAAITDGVQALMTLRPVRYNWIGNGAAGVGFIAQEVRRTMPQLVDTVPGNADMLMLSETGMIPYLVRAVQQLEGELTALRARIR
jgi:hypothetical protein